MNEEERPLTDVRLKTPRAAAVAGILFAVLLITAYVLIRVSIPPDPADSGAWLEEQAQTVALALSLVPIAGIAFLWFIGVLRDRDEVGSTFIRTVERYTQSLQTGGNVLMLEGLSEKVLDQLRRTDLLDLIGEENVFLGQPQHGASLRQALATAEEWLARDQENSG